MPSEMVEVGPGIYERVDYAEGPIDRWDLFKEYMAKEVERINEEERDKKGIGFDRLKIKDHGRSIEVNARGNILPWYGCPALEANYDFPSTIRYMSYFDAGGWRGLDNHRMELEDCVKKCTKSAGYVPKYRYAD